MLTVLLTLVVLLPLATLALAAWTRRPLRHDKQALNDLLGKLNERQQQLAKVAQRHREKAVWHLAEIRNTESLSLRIESQKEGLLDLIDKIDRIETHAANRKAAREENCHVR